MKKSIFNTIFLSFISINIVAQEKYTLEKCLNLALKNNLEVQEANDRIIISELNTKMAKADRYPTLDASGNMSQYIESPSELLPSYLGLAGVNLQSTLYSGGLLNQKVKASLIAEEIAADQLSLTKQNIYFRTQQLYWTIFKLNKQVKLKEVQLESLSKLEKELKAIVGAGLTQKNDLLKVQVAKNDVQLQKQVLENQLIDANNILKQFIGISLLTDIQLTDTITTLVRPSLQQFQSVQIALTNRPEILIRQNEIDLQRRRESITDSEYLPKIGLNLTSISIFSEEVKLEEPFPNATLIENQAYAVFPSLSVSIPLYHHGKRKLDRQEGRIQTKIKERQFKDAKVKVEIEVQKALFDWNESFNQVQVNELSAIQASENLRLFRDQFDAGLVNGSDVLEAQFLWEKAEFNVISGKADYKIKEALVKRVMGER